jgi:hypothetical protein
LFIEIHNKLDKYLELIEKRGDTYFIGGAVDSLIESYSSSKSKKW